MTRERIYQLRKKFKDYEIDGYIIPKNDEFFSEYAQKDRLKTISNFTGSAGFAVILKKKCYLFVDGRYTIQAEIEAGKNFKIINYEKIINCKLFKSLTIGIDPKLFTSQQICKFFSKNNTIKEIESNLVDKISNKYKIYSNPFFSLGKNIVGETHQSKIKKVIKIIREKKSKYLFVSAPENVAWLLNIRGSDNPNSPIPNCRLLISDQKKIFLISEKNKAKKKSKAKKNSIYL